MIRWETGSLPTVSHGLGAQQMLMLFTLNEVTPITTSWEIVETHLAG